MNFERVIAVRTGKTVYRDGDNCIKVFDKDYSKADVLNEALNQARVEETGLNIPKVKEITMIEGKWAIVSQYIKGKTLARLMDESPEKKDEFLSMFVDLHLSVHAKECPLLTKLKEKMDRKIAASELNATVRYDLHMRLEGMPKHRKLCHGDFNPSNIILTRSGVPYILDWSHATQGNASADTAFTYLWFWLSGDEQVAKKYLDLFCVKSGTAKPYVQKWLPIAAAAQSLKGNEKVRQTLLTWADVMDYE